MIKQYRIVEQEQCSIKSLSNVIKLHCVMPEVLININYITINNIFHHTYQLEKKLAYRVLFKKQQYSTNTGIIKEEMPKAGYSFTIKYVINPYQPLNVLFVSRQKSTKMYRK